MKTSVIALLIAATTAYGQCGTVCRSVAQHQAVVVQQQVVAAAVLVPAYFAAYNPAPQAAPPAEKQTMPPADGEPGGIEKKLDQIIELLKALHGKPATPPETAADPNKRAVAVLANSCVKCHSATTAETKGGGFVLMEKDGTLALLGTRDKARIIARVTKGQMPPAPTVLSAEDKDALKKFFSK